MYTSMEPSPSPSSRTTATDSVITLEEGDGNYTNSNSNSNGNSNGNSNDESTFASTIEDSNTVTLDDLHSIDTDNTVLVADASILPESSSAAFTTSMILMPAVFAAIDAIGV